MQILLEILLKIISLEVFFYENYIDVKKVNLRYYQRSMHAERGKAIILHDHLLAQN